ncbi:MAG: outer membrane protein assembly factor BamC [Limnohabitans sp.]|nr:outer membrane protein assembly factor BamC [Limnohabitans sp.]
MGNGTLGIVWSHAETSTHSHVIELRAYFRTSAQSFWTHLIHQGNQLFALHRSLFFIFILVFISGCSSIGGDRKPNYQTQVEVKKTPLDVPPDLSKLAPSARYVIPNANNPNQAPQNIIAPNTVGDIKLERLGTSRWLTTERSPEKVWPLLKPFWEENGFVVLVDNQSTGTLETEWAENRAKLPQDLIRRTLGKLLDSLYSTGERDKFRTRVETTGTNTIEISIIHRGMAEVYKDNNKSSTIWQARPSDPSLEDEFLKRLMVKLGTTQQQAEEALAPTTITVLTSLVISTTQTTIEYKQGFDVAWRRLGVTIDRSGFTVEDRDRKQGLFFVRYVEAVDPDSEPGFFMKLFTRSKAPSGPTQYRLKIDSEGSVSKIQILNASGQADVSTAAKKIAQLIVDDLK